MVCLAPFSSTKVYVGSGGKKASFAAILDGHGGQQKRQHSSRTDSPFMALPSFSSLELFEMTLKDKNWAVKRGVLWEEESHSPVMREKG